MVKKKAEMAVCPQLVEIKFKNYKRKFIVSGSNKAE